MTKARVATIERAATSEPTTAMALTRREWLMATELISLTLFNFIYYYKFLTSFFTGQDTLFQIAFSKYDSFAGLIGVITSPQMGDDYFIGGACWYRPFVSLLYGIEYALWGINPLGYHVFDLMLHVAVVLLLFWLVRMVFESDLTAWLAAMMFSAHPAVLRSLAGPGGAGDIPFSAFFLLTLLAFIAYRKNAGKGMLYLSLVAYGLALMSKETAYFIWPLLFAWVWIFQEKGLSTKNRLLNSLKQAYAYPLLAGSMLIIRTIVLRGIGGYQNDIEGIGGLWKLSINHANDFFLSLFSMQSSLFTFQDQEINLSGIIYPLVILLMFYAVVLRQRLISCFRNTRDGRSVLFFLCWLTLPFLLMLVTRTFSNYQMYFPSIPFSILLAYLLAKGLRKPFTGMKTLEGLITRIAQAGLIVIVAIVVSSAFGKIYEYDEKDTASVLFSGINNTVLANPEVEHFVIYDFPRSVTRFDGGSLEATKELDRRNLAAWLELSFPGRPLQMDISGYRAIEMDTRNYHDPKAFAALDFVRIREAKDRVGIYVLSLDKN